MITQYVLLGLGDVLATPAPTGVEVDTEAVLTFLASKIAPIVIGVLGIIFIGRAGKGEVSKVVTSSAIAIIGLVFLAGSAVLALFGNTLVDLFFK